MIDEEQRVRRSNYLREFDSIDDRWINDALDIKPSERPETLYHYTNAAGLYGIINSTKLWLTDYRFLNDKAEFVHIKEQVKELLTKSKENANSKDLIRLHDEIANRQEEGQKEPGYVFSLTEEADDLGQWRTYGNDGRGFAIGYSTASLDKLSVDSQEFALSKVKYDDKAEQRCLSMALKEYIDHMKTVISANPSDKNVVVDATAISFDYMARARAAVAKHQSFSSEREWRLISYSSGPTDVKVRLGENRLIPYLAVPHKGDATATITRIGIGPGFTGTEIVKAVEVLAQGYPTPIDIYFADTPYRRV